jgi:O-antigen/teichoic acid export membrane protein
MGSKLEEGNNKKVPQSVKSELFRHVSSTFLLKIFGLFLQVTMGIALARILGASGYGIYAFPIAVLHLLNVPATAGLPNLIVRLVANYNLQNRFSLIKGLFFRASQFIFVFSCSLAFIAFLSYFKIGKIQIGTLEGNAFFIAMLLLPIVALNSIPSAILMGFRFIFVGQFPEFILRPAIFLIFVFVTDFLFPDLSRPDIFMFFQVLATGIALVTGFIFLIFYCPEKVKTDKTEFNTVSWLKSAVPFMLVGVVMVINSQTDILMLGLLRKANEVGIYKAVVSASTLITFVLSSANIVLGPQIARLWSLGKKEELQKILTIAARIISFFVAITSVVLILWGKTLLTVFFGQEFGEGYAVLKILCIGQIINGFAGSVGLILQMTGFEKKVALAVGWAAVINVLLNLILVPDYGMSGAAIASAISLSFWNVLLIYWNRKLTGLNPTPVNF